MEITKQLHLSSDQRNLVEMHSALNILNILTYELLNLSDLIDDQEALMPSMTKIQEIASTLTNKNKTLKHLAQIEQKKEETIAHIEQAINKSEEKQNIGKSVENIKSLFEVLEIRAAEIIARERMSSFWVKHEVEELKKNFRDFFSAMEQNSRGRYTIVHNEAAHNNDSYLIRYTIEGQTEGTICMSPEMQDVLRDLIANARKYTDPGGVITADLRADVAFLQLSVEDTGKGIPDNEIESIIEYGRRASNAEEKRSYGGGFGLTKAYYICQKYNGRMWIDSEIHKGTRILMKVPIPQGACT